MVQKDRWVCYKKVAQENLVRWLPFSIFIVIRVAWGYTCDKIAKNNTYIQKKWLHNLEKLYELYQYQYAGFDIVLYFYIRL